MSKRLDDLVAAMRVVLPDTAADGGAEIGRILREIENLGEPECIGKLSLLLRDDLARETVLFAIVHFIERFDRELYIDQLFRVSPLVSPESMEWAQLLHKRIMNSETFREAYVERLRRADFNEKAAVRSLLKQIVESRPEFEDRVRTILDES